MKTRVDKFISDDTGFAPRRTAKNKELYSNIKTSDLDNFNIGSNAKVIGENDSKIDIDRIKEILEKNYQDTPKRRSIKFEVADEEEFELEKTREYDINAILEKAREEKEVDYQAERLKKVRDTQYDILKSLELDAAKSSNEKDAKEELLELINTINLNEKQKKALKETIIEDTDEDLDPLDILSDLRGDENTIVAGAKDFTDEIATLDKEKTEEVEIKKALDEDIDNSFYTNSMSFSKKDFASLDEQEKNTANIIIKILIVLVFLAIVAGLVLFLNEFLNLGWF